MIVVSEERHGATIKNFKLGFIHHHSYNDSFTQSGKLAERAGATQSRNSL